MIRLTMYILIMVLFSINCFSQNFWQQINYSGPYTSAVCFSTNGDFYAGCNYSGFGANYSLNRSTNRGSTWLRIDMSIPDRGDGGGGDYDIFSLIACDSNIIIAGAWAVYGNWYYINQWAALLYSSDSGQTWLETYRHSPTIISNIVSSTPDFVLAAAGALLLSTNRGRSWSNIGSGILPEISSVAIDTRGYLYAVSDDANIQYTLFHSTNNGNSWDTIKTLVGVMSEQVAVNAKNYIFVSTTTLTGIGQQPTYVLYRSTDEGISWQPVLTSKAQTKKIFIDSQGYLYLATNNGVLQSTDDGTIWLPLAPSFAVEAFTVDKQGFLYAGGDGIYRSAQIVDEVRTGILGLPQMYLLSQNYPNPFNPATTISFNLPSNAFTTLKIFDLTGKEVTTILSQELKGGNHTIQWNAAGIPSGVYFYCLQAGSFLGTKKLVLLK
jgi:photosystem II stability/assembly factor-like uncharacterized protein